MYNKSTTSSSLIFTLIWILIAITTVSCETSVGQEIPVTATDQPSTPAPTEIVSAVKEPEIQPTATNPILEEGDGFRVSICPNLYSPRGKISWSPDGKYLAYTARNERIQILTLDADQSITSNVPITPLNPEPSLGPAWALDSQRISYMVHRALYLSDIHGNWQPGSHASPVTNVQWFPDGERMLLTLYEPRYETSEDGLYSDENIIAVYNLQTEVLNTLVETSADLVDDRVTSPHLSPDGNYVVYDATPDLWDDFSGIYLIDVNGGQPVKISADETCEAGPRWSPDGERIAFVSHRDGENLWDWNLFVMDKDGRNAIKLTNSWENDYYAPQQYVWSPDGTKILYLTHKRVGSPDNFIKMVDVSTGEITDILTEDEEIWGFEDPEWSPNGDVVAFTFKKRGVNGRFLGIINLESGAVTELATIYG